MIQAHCKPLRNLLAEWLARSLSHALRDSWLISIDRWTIRNCSLSIHAPWNPQIAIKFCHCTTIPIVLPFGKRLLG